MKYNVPENFDLTAFLDACGAEGVWLYVRSESDPVDGWVIRQGSSLMTTLNMPDEAKQAIITAKVAAQGGSPA